MKPSRSALILPASIALVAALSGCGSDSGAAAAAPATAEAETFTADLTLISSIPVTLDYANGETCSGMGNGGMEGGNRYTVSVDGKTIQHGELPYGKVVEVDGVQECFFRFKKELPAGLGYYTVDLGDFQGYFEASEEELAEGYEIDRVDFEGRRP